jgi:RNA polymerase sigma-B factor
MGTLDAGYERTDAALTARSLLARLPAHERRIVELRFIDELSHSKIAEQLGISQVHVLRLLRRALAELSASRSASTNMTAVSRTVSPTRRI